MRELITRFLINYSNKHPRVVVSFFVFVLGLIGINTYANHDAMEHGYDRTLKIGPIESGVQKTLQLPEDLADGGQPLIE